MDPKTKLTVLVIVNRLTDMYEVGMRNAGLSEDEINEVKLQVEILQLKDMLGLTSFLDPVE